MAGDDDRAALPRAEGAGAFEARVLRDRTSCDDPVNAPTPARTSRGLFADALRGPVYNAARGVSCALAAVCVGASEGGPAIARRPVGSPSPHLPRALNAGVVGRPLGCASFERRGAAPARAEEGSDDGATVGRTGAICYSDNWRCAGDAGACPVVSRYRLSTASHHHRGMTIIAAMCGPRLARLLHSRSGAGGYTERHIRPP